MNTRKKLELAIQQMRPADSVISQLGRPQLGTAAPVWDATSERYITYELITNILL